MNFKSFFCVTIAASSLLAQSVFAEQKLLIKMKEDQF